MFGLGSAQGFSRHEPLGGFGIWVDPIPTITPTPPPAWRGQNFLEVWNFQKQKSSFSLYLAKLGIIYFTFTCIFLSQQKKADVPYLLHHHLGVGRCFELRSQVLWVEMPGALSSDRLGIFRFHGKPFSVFRWVRIPYRDGGKTTTKSVVLPLFLICWFVQKYPANLTHQLSDFGSGVYGSMIYNGLLAHIPGRDPYKIWGIFSS